MTLIYIRLIIIVTIIPIIIAAAQAPARSFIWGFDYNFTNYNFRKTLYSCLAKSIAVGVKFKVLFSKSRLSLVCVLVCSSCFKLNHLCYFRCSTIDQSMLAGLSMFQKYARCQHKAPGHLKTRQTCWQANPRNPREREHVYVLCSYNTTTYVLKLLLLLFYPRERELHLARIRGIRGR